MPHPSQPNPIGITQPVPILMYHAVEDAVRPPAYKHFYVLAREFAWQMHALKRAGYTAITLARLADALDGRGALPPRPIVLTFDDGYLNLKANVHPLLRELGFDYTVFLVADKVGKTNDWVAPEGYQPTPLLGWPDIVEMQRDGGVSFEAHTLTHPRLTQLSPDALRRELGDSKAILEDKLQVPTDVLCYPYGAVSDKVAQAAREAGYALAVTTQTGRARAGDDKMRLPRISVSHVPALSATYGIGALNFWWRVRLWKDGRPESMPEKPQMAP